jgi:hypothetical protein
MTYWAMRLRFACAAHLWHPAWLNRKQKLLPKPEWTP